MKSRPIFLSTRKTDFVVKIGRVSGPRLALGREENFPGDSEGLDVSFRDVVSNNYRHSWNGFYVVGVRDETLAALLDSSSKRFSSYCAA